MESTVRAKEEPAVAGCDDKGVGQSTSHDLGHSSEEGLSVERSESKVLLPIVPEDEADHSMAQTTLTVEEDRVGGSRHVLQT